MLASRWWNQVAEGTGFEWRAMMLLLFWWTGRVRYLGSFLTVAAVRFVR